MPVAAHNKVATNHVRAQGNRGLRGEGGKGGTAGRGKGGRGREGGRGRGGEGRARWRSGGGEIGSVLWYPRIPCIYYSGVTVLLKGKPHASSFG